MKTLDLGKVAIRPKGEYSPDVLYDALDLITHNNASWLVLKDVTGITPANGEYYQLLVKDGVGKKRTVRTVIGTSTNGWTEDDCDYLCDGVDDQVEINAAIQALPEGGGEIIILDGTYNITAWIINTEKENVTISGNGFSTILNRMISRTTAAVVMFDAANCAIKDLAVIGDKEQYPGYGIELRGNCVGCIISGVYVKGISDGGVRLDTGSNCILTNSVFEDCGDGSVKVTRGSSGTMIGNVISNNTFLNAQNAIWIFGAGTSVTGNTILNAGRGVYAVDVTSEYTEAYGNSITGNIIQASVDGVLLQTCCKTCVSGNSFIDCGTAIHLDSRSKQSVITGNLCVRGNGIASDYASGQYTIRVLGDNNLIAGNLIMGKNYTDSGTGNTFADNKYQ